MKKNGERIQNDHENADKILDKLLKEALRPVQKPSQELNDSVIRSMDRLFEESHYNKVSGKNALKI